VTHHTSDDPFAAYHRRQRPGIVLRRSLLAVVGVGILAAAILLTVTAPPARASAPLALASNTIPRIQPDTSGTPAPNAATAALATASSPAPAPNPAPSAPPAEPTAQPAAPYSITITATGYQTQVDQCQWVRMDLGAAAPIVGAHTSCGGAIVLTMKPGQQVDLTGQGLTGQYIVTGSRNVHAGQNAATATSGMTADVLLQTCYYTGDGSELLIALTRQQQASP
jgi:hypothetical protein